MKENLNNKDLIIKKLIYRSKYTGTKETDILLSNFVDAYIYDLTFEQLKTYQSILDSGDPRIWRLAIDNEISNDEKELYLLNMIKKSGNINDWFKNQSRAK